MYKVGFFPKSVSNLPDGKSTQPIKSRERSPFSPKRTKAHFVFCAKRHRSLPCCSHCRVAAPTATEEDRASAAARIQTCPTARPTSRWAAHQKKVTLPLPRATSPPQHALLSPKHAVCSNLQCPVRSSNLAPLLARFCLAIFSSLKYALCFFVLFWEQPWRP